MRLVKFITTIIIMNEKLCATRACIVKIKKLVDFASRVLYFFRAIIIRILLTSDVATKE